MSTTFTKKRKNKNQIKFAIQASVFSCPFLHVHQSAKPDVQMCCVGKQALVWANIALMSLFSWARNQTVHSSSEENWGWVTAGPAPWAQNPFLYSLTPRARDNKAQQGSERWVMLQDLLSTSFPRHLSGIAMGFDRFPCLTESLSR